MDFIEKLCTWPVSESEVLSIFYQTFWHDKTVRDCEKLRIQYVINGKWWFRFWKSHKVEILIHFCLDQGADQNKKAKWIEKLKKWIFPPNKILIVFPWPLCASSGCATLSVIANCCCCWNANQQIARNNKRFVLKKLLSINNKGAAERRKISA